MLLPRECFRSHFGMTGKEEGVRGQKKGGGGGRGVIKETAV